MIKVLITFMFLSTGAFASDCQDLASLFSIYKLKDVISAKGMQVVDEAGQRASKVSPYSVESVCDDHDINNNLKYIQMNNFKNNCQIKNHTESLDLPSSTTLTDALEDKLNGYGHRCSSQEQEQYETYITRLVRRVKTKFSRPDSETKDICNTVRKALSKLSQLENSCNES